MAAINQDRELNSCWPTERRDCVHGRAYSAAREQHVIDNDDGFGFQRQWQVGRSYHR
jgi:hypothetical protein